MSRRQIAGWVAVAFAVVALIAVSGAPLMAQVSQPAQQQGDFVPVKDLPAVQQEHVPAAPLVMIAYAFVWVALLVYVWSLWRRVGAVQRELADLRRRVERKA